MKKIKFLAEKEKEKRKFNGVQLQPKQKNSVVSAPPDKVTILAEIFILCSSAGGLNSKLIKIVLCTTDGILPTD